jgi:DnaJ-class molecular chaperone
VTGMRQSRRTKAHASARRQRTGITLLWLALDAECFTDDGDDGPRACRACDGDGSDPMTDYVLECPHCGGTGREG